MGETLVMDRLDMLHQGQDIPLPASDEELFLIAARETSRSLGLERCVVSAEAEAARLRGVITELRQEAAQRSAAHRAEASVLAARIEELEHEKGTLVEFVRVPTRAPSGVIVVFRGLGSWLPWTGTGGTKRTRAIRAQRPQAAGWGAERQL